MGCADRRPVEADVPVCPECQGDLGLVGIEDLNFDSDSISFDLWRCGDCVDERGQQIDYHYPQGMFKALPV